MSPRPSVWPLWLAVLLWGGRALAQTLSALVSSGLAEPYGVAVDVQNNYYVSDSANNRIVKIAPDTGALTNFAGLPGPIGGYQDGLGSFAQFYSPQGIVVVPARGGLVVADSGNHLLRLVAFDGRVSTLAGSTRGKRDGPAGQAQFYAPASLAADAAGNIFVADLQNNAVRRLGLDDLVTTIATNFFRPSGVSVGSDGRVYVADTGNQCVKVIETSLEVRLLAGSGSPRLFAWKDSPTATEALFDAPNSVFWVGGTLGLLVGDSGNHVVRRVFLDATATNYAVGTYAPSLTAGLGNVTGMAKDLGGNLLFVDLAHDAVLRAGAGQVVLPPVSNPVIGYVVLTNTAVFTGTKLFPISNSTFNNDVVVGVLSEAGTQTYYTVGASDAAEGLADPTPGSPSPPLYSDGLPSLPRSILPQMPDATIRAISTQPDRRPSEVVSARVRFQVANPVIFGLNPAAFTLDSATQGAELWYTTDGADPAPFGSTARQYESGSRLNVINGTNDILFKVRGFKAGYSASAVVQSAFAFTNVQTSSIGFARDFTGAPGATLLLPIEVRLAGTDRLRSLQFRAEVTANGAAPTMLEPLGVAPTSAKDIVPMPGAGGKPLFVTNYVNGSTAGLGVAYVGTDSLGPVGASGPVTVLHLKVPVDAQHGQTYRLALREASGTPDGWQTPLDLTLLLDRKLVVTNLSYLVGDVAPADGYNASEFGDSKLGNNDVNTVFLASLGVRMPFLGTDLFDAMDAFPEDAPGVVGGDGQIRFLDWQVVLQRALRLAPLNWWRMRGPLGERASTPKAITSAASFPAASLGRAAAVPAWQRQARFWAGVVENARPGAEVQAPLWLNVAAGFNWAGGQFWPVVSLRRDGTETDVPVRFIPQRAGGIPEPGANGVPGGSTNNVAYAWDLGAFQPALTGSNLLGWLSFQVPTLAAGTVLHVRVVSADGASSRHEQLDCESIPGSVWVLSPAARAPEAISDEWRLHFFGSLTAAEAQAAADPDHDGLSNLSEYSLNLNPLTPDWRVTAVRANGRVGLRFFAEGGRAYQPLGSANLADWQPLGPALSGADRTLEFTDANPPANRRFYRVRILP